MPDITMCRGEGCSKRNNCKRFVSKPKHLSQSYFTKTPLKNGDCEYFYKTN